MYPKYIKDELIIIIVIYIYRTTYFSDRIQNKKEN